MVFRLVCVPYGPYGQTLSWFPVFHSDLNNPLPARKLAEK